jgi:hypothetical protein
VQNVAESTEGEGELALTTKEKTEIWKEYFDK